MNLRRLCTAALAVALLIIIVPNSAQAQAAGGAGAGGAGAGGRQGGNRQRGANADPAQARQRQLDRIKQQLGSSDDEWKVLEPKVDKLLTAQQDARGGRGGAAGGGRRNRGGQQGAQAATPAPTTVEPSAVAKATTELRAAVDDKSSTAEVLAEKLKALRDAKEKAKTDRATAQKELRELLTARQEAVLVNMGMLD